MVKLTINGRQIEVAEGTTLLEAARQLGIRIPTLCYLKDINEVGACRVCLVEAEGVDRLLAACNSVCEEGMVIRTDTPRVRAARRTNVQLILSQHHTACTTCVRDGSCQLQAVARDLNITNPVEEVDYRPLRWDTGLPLIRDDSKCIQCYRCVNECDKVQDLRVWDIIGTGRHSRVGLRAGAGLTDMCSLCGQCITHCPTGALSARDDTDRFYQALYDPETITVVQVAPAVRSAYGESIGLSREQATEGRMAAAIKALGVDYVFDTNFSADLTIMEEGSELLQYLGNRKSDYPMFTSCCPGWVRFMKLRYPDMVTQLSSAKSPQQMFGAVTKSYFAQKIGVDPSKIFSVSIMPCSAKKYECDVPELQDAAHLDPGYPGMKDVDLVLTTRELARLLRSIDVASLEEIPFDSPLGSGTGAAVIFGRTGGVMEAALRSACYLVTGKNPDPETFRAMRADHSLPVYADAWREAEYDVAGTKVRVAVASGLGNAGRLIDAIRRGDVHYDFVEIMACPGGCAGGGGQPIHDGTELAADRGDILDALDANNPIRYSHENPDVIALYKEYMDKPLSEKAHHLLHTSQKDWTL